MFSSQRRQPAKTKKLEDLATRLTASTSSTTTIPTAATRTIPRNPVTLTTVTKTIVLKQRPTPPPIASRTTSNQQHTSTHKSATSRSGINGKRKLGDSAQESSRKKNGMGRPSSGSGAGKRRVVSSSDEASTSEEDEETEENAMQRIASEAPTVPETVERDVLATQDAEGVKCISAEDLVMANRSVYVDFFVDPSSDGTRPPGDWYGGGEGPVVVLEYPGTKATERFLLLAPKVGDEYEPIQDLLETIRLILDIFLTPSQSLSLFSHVPTTSSAFASFLSASAPPSRSGTPSTPTGLSDSPSPPLMRALEKARSKKDGPSFLASVERFNTGMRQLKEEAVLRENIGKMRGVQERVWTKVVGQVYERTVGPEINRLSEYEAFSDNVYGELLPKFMGEIFQKTKLTPSSVFVDLGSGVGNCIVQSALATGCESWGFENMAHASALARAQVKEAEGRFRMWGLSAGEMHVVEADFCESPEVGKVLQRADVVLVNNEVFSSSLNDRLSLLFLDLPTSSLIVSLKAFASSFTLSAHNLHSPLAILDQGKELRYGRKSVSWKDGGGTYFIARVDRTMLENWVTREEERRVKREERERREREMGAMGEAEKR